MSPQNSIPTAAGGEQPSTSQGLSFGGWLRLRLPGGLSAALGDPAAVDWQRPGPSRAGLRRDFVGALLLTSIGWLALALTESYMGVTEGRQRWWGYAVIAVLTLPLAWRRRYPITALAIGTVVFMAGSYLNGHAVMLLSTQVVYFAFVYAAVAWGRSRQVVALAVVLLGIVMAVWLLIDLTISSSYQDYLADLGSDVGPFRPMTGFALYSVLLNVAFFGAAVYAGRASWRAALRRRQNQDQARTIEVQAKQLAQRAVMDERLRIARELHDVVAHHVSAIGIQAGAARKMLTHDVSAAQEALRTVESSSRQAVAETRQLLGVLRADPGDRAGFGAHSVHELDALVQDYAQRGLTVTLELDLEESTSLDRIPPALGSSLYRCVQESLANVLRHSTATRVRVTLRTTHRETSTVVELEVLDRGQAKPNSAGSGYGLAGLQERAHLHGGTCQAGPRDPGPGWHVRMTFPVLADTTDVAPDPDREHAAGGPGTVPIMGDV